MSSCGDDSAGTRTRPSRQEGSGSSVDGISLVAHTRAKRREGGNHAAETGVADNRRVDDVVWRSGVRRSCCGHVRARSARRRQSGVPGRRANHTSGMRGQRACVSLRRAIRIVGPPASAIMGKERVEYWRCRQHGRGHRRNRSRQEGRVAWRRTWWRGRQSLRGRAPALTAPFAGSLVRSPRVERWSYECDALTAILR